MTPAAAGVQMTWDYDQGPRVEPGLFKDMSAKMTYQIGACTVRWRSTSGESEVKKYDGT